MGLFDSIIAGFTGSYLNQGINQAEQELRAGGVQALDTLGGASDYIRDSGARADELLAGAGAQGRADLQGGIDRALELLDPTISAGNTARARALDLLGLGDNSAAQVALEDLANSPAYQFREEQGRRAIENAASASGSLNSGPLAKDLTRFGQGLASTEFSNNFNRLLSLISPGDAAASQGAGLTSQNGVNLANLGTSIGSARAANERTTGSGLAQLQGAESSLIGNNGVQLANLAASGGAARQSQATNLLNQIAKGAGFALGRI